MQRSIFVNDVFSTRQNGDVKVIRYRGKYDIDVKFLKTGFVRTTDASNLKRGSIKDPLYRSIYNRGFLGVGKHEASVGQKATYKYKCWKAIFIRCYDEYALNKRPTYRGCEICEDWLNFQSFGDWFDFNYVDGWELDKDILYKGNKLYSPATCCFVPEEINKLFIKSDGSRGKHPIGVNYHRTHNLYVARMTNGGERIFLGNYNTPIEAFKAYKDAKELHIKAVADKWKPLIPEKLYKAMYSYQVEITD